MHSPSGPKSVSGPEDFARIFDVSRETLARLGCYAELLARWQRSTNLVAPSTLPQVWSRHFADSAQILALAPEARLWLDLGTGAGFPGLVIALLAADSPGFRMHLVDSNAKKCAFLAEAARATKLSVDIHNERIEEFAQKAPRLIPEIVCARALAPLPRLFELADKHPGFSRDMLAYHTITDTWRRVEWLVGEPPNQVKSGRSAEQVGEVVYYDRPAQFQYGISAELRGQFTEALDHFEEAAKAENVRDWIKQYTRFHIAQCLKGMKKHAEAIAAYQKLVEEIPGKSHMGKGI